MTDADWQVACFPEMLLYLRRRTSARKLRLFACACVRLAWAQVNDVPSRRVVETVERFADGLATRRDLAAVRAAAPGRSSDRVAKAAADCAAPGSEAAVFAVTRLLAPMPVGTPAQADLFREIVGNPFQRPPALPHVPATVRQLAQSLYDGADCAFALHDALLDVGLEALAAHFAPRGRWHPKGCWALDRILGKD